MMLDAGITHHKCATLAEAEMLASEKVPHVLVAYQMVGPNLNRVVGLIDKFPETRFALLVDNPLSLNQLVAVLTADTSESKRTAEVMIDLDSGMHRTGMALAANPAECPAAELYEMIAVSYTHLTLPTIYPV